MKIWQLNNNKKNRKKNENFLQTMQIHIEHTMFLVIKFQLSRLSAWVNIETSLFTGFFFIFFKNIFLLVHYSLPFVRDEKKVNIQSNNFLRFLTF